VNELVIASGNEGKIAEISRALKEIEITLHSLRDYDGVPPVEEDGQTYLDNALKKAKSYAAFTGKVVLADDSGLEVDYLNGAPGVYSARYAGLNATDEENNQKLLRQLAGVAANERGATFCCVLVLYEPDGNFHSFAGTWRGVIMTEPAGKQGFGYDPLFYAPELGKTAAQLDPDVKNRVSHRAKALALFQDWLRRYR
jgi:XTP/dITP diphosphohydrolase